VVGGVCRTTEIKSGGPSSVVTIGCQISPCNIIKHTVLTDRCTFFYAASRHWYIVTSVSQLGFPSSTIYLTIYFMAVSPSDFVACHMAL